MENEKISVIIPVYNVGVYLSRCLESVLKQTYKYIEIIAVNDGSTDNSDEVLRQYAIRYPQIKVITQENQGVTCARFCGIKQATGEWIGFVDGDDEIEPNMYEHLLKNAKKYQADISHCGYQMVFENGKINYFHNTGQVIEQDRKKGLEDLLSGVLVEPGLCNKLFHRKLCQSLLKDKRMDTSIRMNEDLLMNFFLFEQANRSIYEDFCPYHYIVRASSVTRKEINVSSINDSLRVRQIIRKCATKEMHDKAEISYIETCINIYNNLIIRRVNLYEKEIKKICVDLKQSEDYFGFLSFKRRIMAKMILYCPAFYKPIYRFYERYLQKKVYG